MVVQMDESLRYIEEFRKATGKRLTVTHLMARAMGAVMAEMPDANAVLRWGNIYLRQDVAVFFQLAMEDPQTGQIDLSGVTIRDADKKSLESVVDDFEASAKKVRAGKDEEKESTRQTMKKLPGWLVGTVLDLLSFFLFKLNLDMRWAGLPKDPFGSVMVTNIGSLGLEEAYVPLVPYSHVPLLIAMGGVLKTPAVADDGSIKVIQTMKLCATFDHRILDGAHAAKMSKTLRAWFEKPYEHFGPIPAAAEKS